MMYSILVHFGLEQKSYAIENGDMNTIALL